MVDVSRILSALGAPSTTKTNLQVFHPPPLFFLQLLISTYNLSIVIPAHCRQDQGQFGYELFLETILYQ